MLGIGDQRKVGLLFKSGKGTTCGLLYALACVEESIQQLGEDRLEEAVFVSDYPVGVSADRPTRDRTYKRL